MGIGDLAYKLAVLVEDNTANIDMIVIIIDNVAHSHNYQYLHEIVAYCLGSA